MSKQPDSTEGKIVAVETAFTKTELFIEKNQKILTIVVGAIVVIVLAYMGYKRYIVEPREKEALGQMFMAEKYFEIDSLRQAVNGDGNYLGFMDIIDEYSGTKAANLAHYYLGICYLKKGEYQKAIDYLEKFHSSDQIVGPTATGRIGDAYMELGNTEKAAEYYMKAANQKTNNFTTPQFLMRAGWAYEELKQYDKALEAYQRIEKEFYKSIEAKEIEKYIARMKELLAKAK